MKGKAGVGECCLDPPLGEVHGSLVEGGEGVDVLSDGAQFFFFPVMDSGEDGLE